MAELLNLTPLPAAIVVGRAKDGATVGTVTVKRTFTWDTAGSLADVEPPPLRAVDGWAGDPSASGLIRASEIGPAKERVDVLFEGAIVLSAPMEVVDVGFSVGGRLRKVARVFGDRAWVPGLVADLTPSRPRAVTRVPIAWESAFGGADPRNPSFVDRRNPVGSGIASARETLEGKRAPSFEDPAAPIKSWKDRPAPVGFGPIAAHWMPRVQLAGTYDERWRHERSPLLPVDFNPAFFNVAPLDQQLDVYLPNEELRLMNFTKAGRDLLRLPSWSVPVTFVGVEEMGDAVTKVDTITLDPEARTLTLLGRASFPIRPDIVALRQVVVGELTRGRRAAMETGKIYVARKPRQ